MLIIQGGIDTETFFDSPPVSDLLAGASALMIAVDLIGLPLPLARQSRFPAK